MYQFRTQWLMYLVTVFVKGSKISQQGKKHVFAWCVCVCAHEILKDARANVYVQDVSTCAYQNYYVNYIYIYTHIHVQMETYTYQ
jgi:hypothetical protein